MVQAMSPLARAQAFCDAFQLRLPILMAPMAGACPASLAIAVANAGGLGGCGALLMKPEAIRPRLPSCCRGSNSARPRTCEARRGGPLSPLAGRGPAG
jgi:nitronate monooxygenase